MALSAFENDGGRAFDISGLTAFCGSAYDQLPPIQWPLRAGHDAAERRLFGEGGFFTPDRRARFIAVHASPASEDERFPLRLNTGRIRDQWHTMTRTGKSPRLARHTAEPHIDVHPDDARRHGLEDGGLARVSTRHGHCLLRVRVTPGQQPGSIFAPIHWSAENASQGRIGALVHALTDAVSGQPDSKATAARIAPVHFRYRGFIVSRSLLSLDCAYWVRVREKGGWLYIIAMQRPPGATWRDWFLDLIGTDGAVLELNDRHSDSYRAAAVHDGRLRAATIITAGDDLPGSAWLAELLGDIAIDPNTRRALLAARMPQLSYDQGPIVCACFGVGLNRIGDAIARQKLSSVEAIGQALKAGTNCGSCTPELRRILDHTQALAP